MKRIKATLKDLIDNNISYFSFLRIKTPERGRGYRYILDKPLTPEQSQILKLFKNVYIGGCYCSNAPEIKHQYIILFDTCGGVKK